VGNPFGVRVYVLEVTGSTEVFPQRKGVYFLLSYLVMYYHIDDMTDFSKIKVD